MIAFRLGLLPEVLERIQPVDLWSMWKGWRWRWSRELEVQMIAAAASNGFARVDSIALCRSFQFYLAPPRGRG